jgi:hypothetical protein
MTKYTYEVSYTEFASGVIEANTEAEAEYQLEQDYIDFEDLSIIAIEEVVD